MKDLLELQMTSSYMHNKDDEEHDRRLHKFMRVARECGLVLNKSKCEVKKASVKFFDCVYDKHQAHLDPSQFSAAKELLAPKTKGKLQSFLGMVTCLAPFIQLFSHTAMLRGLLKNDNTAEMLHAKSHFTSSSHWYMRIQH